MTVSRPIALRHATSFLVVFASLQTLVTPACDVIDPLAVTMVPHSSDGFSVPGLTNSFQCRRLCLRTTGCSAVAFDSDVISGTTNCTLNLSPPTSPTGEQQAGQEGGSACELPCDNRPCGYGETCSRGYVSTGPTYRCHSLLRCNDPPVLQNRQREAQNKMLGATVEYSCDAPYLLIKGNSSVTCTYTGHWTNLEDKCIKFIPVPGYNKSFIKVADKKGDFLTGRSWCNSEYGGHLVGIQDDQKWQAVTKALDDSGVLSAGSLTTFVLVDGFEESESDRFYLWNGKQSLIESAWGLHEPNSSPNEHCLTILRSDLTIHDYPCNDAIHFVCEVTVDN